MLRKAAVLINNVGFGKQTHVYFKKIARIALREKAWKFVVFAAIIACIVAWITSEDMFENYESTKSGFFTLVSACIWLGIFNSIQSICKEHDIIRSEYRQGMKISSYICANIIWQALLCLVQSVITYGICIAFGFFANCPSDGVLMPAFFEYFITIYLMTFGSAVMGIMVSSVASDSTTAMTIMPFVLIMQLMMCGVLYELDGLSEKIAYITFSKWGMSAFGSTGDLNNVQQLVSQKLPDLAQMIEEQFPAEDAYLREAGTLAGAWLWSIGITVVSAVVSILSLKIKNRDS